MSKMPYQRLQRSGNILIAARGSSIDSFGLQDGSLLSTWTNAPPPKPEPEPSTSSPPAKRRKITTEENSEKEEESKGDTSKSQNGSGPPKNEKKKQNNRSDAVASGLESPAIICLSVTKDGNHVIAVTAEDKSIRVFENILTAEGKQELVLLSLRQMPKRPCAIILTSDDQTIISADKFGDVYSLPLIPAPPSSSPTPLPSSTPEPSATPKLFTPAANELTIHSQRNLKALANQRRQKGNNPAPEKPLFAGTLLLGHVSMLTDIILGHHDGRSYILTADRDEHIRISRGIPQTHVIEGFCLGHEQFITRLCIPASQETILISGGGDDELYVWEWLSGALISKVDLKSHVVPVVGGVEDMNITVSAIVHVQVPGQGNDGMVDLIIVTCEGVPAIFTFQLTPVRTLTHLQTTALFSNPLDISLHTSLTVSLDTIHESGSTTSRRDPTSSTKIKPFQVFDWQTEVGLLVENEKFVFATDSVTDGGEEGIGGSEGGSVTNLLYSLENLRKREGEDKEE